MDIGGSNEALLVRLLGAATARSQVLAANISNQNTPGYTRRVLHFEKILRSARERGDHDLSGIEPVIEEDDLTPRGEDGNNVLLELELNAMRENRLLYETYSSILRGHYELLRASIQER